MNELEDDAIEVLLAVSESWMQVHLEYRGGGGGGEEGN